MKLLTSLFALAALASYATADDLVCQKSPLNFVDPVTTTTTALVNGIGSVELDLDVDGYTVQASTLLSQVTVIAKKGDTTISTAGEKVANLRIQTATEVYEYFCQIEATAPATRE